MSEGLFFPDTLSLWVPADVLGPAPVDDPVQPHPVFSQKFCELPHGKSLHVGDEPESLSLENGFGLLADSRNHPDRKGSKEFLFRSIRDNRNAVRFYPVGGNLRNCFAGCK